MCATINDSAPMMPITHELSRRFDRILQEDVILNATLETERPKIHIRREEGTLFLEVDFSQILRLRDPMEELQDEEERKDWFASITKHVFKVLKEYATEQEQPLVVEKVVLNGTQASLRSVLNLTGELKVLHMNNTNVSDNSLRNLYRWTELEELHMDNCRGITGSVFRSLTRTPVKRISLVNTDAELSRDWMSYLMHNCANLEELYIGKNLTGKCEGLYDIVSCQTLKNPCLLNCGHVADKITLELQARIGRQNRCSICRKDYNPAELIPFRPRVFHRYKEAGVWKSEPVDAKRRPLSDRMLYHITCGELFTAETIQDLFLRALSLEELQTEQCPSCQEEFKGTLRVCYLNELKGGTMAEEGFEKLEDLGEYSIRDARLP